MYAQDYSLLVVVDNDSRLIHCGIIGTKQHQRQQNHFFAPLFRHVTSGSLDYLRKFTWDKKLETIGKSSYTSPQPPSAAPISLNSLRRHVYPDSAYDPAAQRVPSLLSRQKVFARCLKMSRACFRYQKRFCKQIQE